MELSGYSQHNDKHVKGNIVKKGTRADDKRGVERSNCNWLQVGNSGDNVRAIPYTEQPLDKRFARAAPIPMYAL